MKFESSVDFAIQCDHADPLKEYKKAFHFPQHNGNPAIYFCGNSLGLQPLRTAEALEIELKTWREKAVGGYFDGPNPWLFYHEYCKAPLAGIVGALPVEIAVMNALTVNLHMMMLSFYRPTASRYKIIMEAGAFPSDQYAMETQVKLHGFDPADAIIEVHPRPGEKLLRTGDIIALIEENAASIALVMFSGMNYYTGQLFDIKAITAAGKKAGAFVGWDLAHVVGNVPVNLHDDGADFAVWCSYKYLNSGPGAVGGAFVHEKHAKQLATPRAGGWWGNDEKTRFRMEKGFIPKADAAGWHQSTSQVFNTAALRASLSLFEEAGMQALRKKSVTLTAYLEFLLGELNNIPCEIITPKDQDKRGAQLSLFFTENGKAIHDKMISEGIIVDYREPGVIRVAPAPLYCSFQDVYRFYEILKTHF